MSLIVSGIKCPPGTGSEETIGHALKLLGISKSRVSDCGIYKVSVDARKRDDIKLVCSVILSLKSPAEEQRLSRRKDCRIFSETEPEIKISPKKADGRTVVTGFGPAGMFCALLLAENGYRPVVIERGADVETRTEAVGKFWAGGELDENSTVQFGEGGAGTFSDGKLTTRIGDPLCRYVLKRLREFGAPDEILYLSKPHIGTDRLRETVKNIRERIISLGGEVRFLCRLDGLKISGGRVIGAITDRGEIPAASLVLAIGHSARDTFKKLLDTGVNMEPKPFSIGARIEHTQLEVDYSLYGGGSGEMKLPKGEYQLSHRRPDGRAAYTFCMCPGGEVVCASSEAGGVVTNGMSRYLRDGRNANAAVAVSVSKGDFPPGVLGGMELQRQIEHKAYEMTGSYLAPAQTVGAFLDGKPALRSVIPSYLPGVKECDLNELFPGFISEMMKEGLRKFSHEMKCFGNMEAVLTAPETRTSSPVRIIRNTAGLADGFENLYPCGEGAGYAGGIMSAAVDGLRTAMSIMSEYGPG